VEGRDLDIGGSDPKTRIVKGFHELLVRTYPNLRMLRGIDYAQSDVAQFLKPERTFLGDDPATFGEAEQEVLAFVRGNNRQGLRTTMQSLVNHFEHKPYGWYLAAIQGTVAKLLGRGKLEMQRDASILEGEELEQALLNTHSYGNLVLEPQIEFTASQIRALRDFYGEFFDQPTATREAKALGRETAEAFQTLRQDLIDLKRRSEAYPFLAALDGPIERLGELTGKRYTFYLTDLRRHEDELFDMKERVVDPIRRFMSGPQREIYDDARRFLEHEEANFSYLEGDEAARLGEILADPQVYTGKHMQTAKQLLDTLKQKVEARVVQEREATIEQLREYQDRLEGTEEFAALTEEERARLRRPFDELARQIERQRLIAVMRDSLRRFYETKYPQMFQQMEEWATPTREEAGEDPDEDTACRERSPEYVGRAALHIPFAKPWLGDEDDVDAYLAVLRKALLEAIEEGKRVQI
jgi:hypothetical protein